MMSMQRKIQLHVVRLTRGIMTIIRGKHLLKHP